MDRFAVFAFRWMAARSCSLMRMLIFLFFISYSVSKSGCRASARRAAAAGGRLWRRPAVCDARTLPTGRVQRCHSPHRESTKVQPCVIQPVITAERKKAHMPPITPYFACMRNRRGFICFCVLIGTQGVFCGCFGRGKSSPPYFFLLL